MDIVYPDKYFSAINEKFPELSEKQIKDIIYYGTRALFMLCYHGVDIKCQQGKFFVYFGELFKTKESYVRYRRARLAAKYRIYYAREKKPYSGKYYFMLSKEVHDNLPKNKKSGEKWPIGAINIYKIKEEAMLQDGTYLYELDFPKECGYKKLIYTHTIKHYRCIGKRTGFRDFEPVSTEDKEKTVKKSQKKGGK